MIVDPAMAEIGEPIVTLRMTKGQAEQVSHALSDILCWAAGFIAARPDDTARHPGGLGETRELNIALKRAIDETDAPALITGNEDRRRLRTIVVHLFDGGGLEVVEGGGTTGVLTWEEALGQMAELTHPKLGAARFPMMAPEAWAARRSRSKEQRS